MKHRNSRLTYLGIGLVATGALLVPTTSATAAKKGRKPAKVQRVDTPLGSQGKRGAGANVVLPFTLVDSSRRPTNVEVEYGIVLEPVEGAEEQVVTWFPASENRQDERNTRKNSKPRKFTTAANVGAAQAFVWNSVEDLETDRRVTLQTVHDDEGRPVEDPNSPGSFLILETNTGVRLRSRAVTGKGKRKRVGDWTVSDAFTLNNNSRPSVTVDGVEFNSTSTPPAADETVFINWTAIDPDSEDANGNGEVDFVQGEDRNGNGQADLEELKIHFDYYRVQPGEDPTTFTAEELDGLFWQPCTNATGEGDPNTGVPSSPVGLSYQFAWNSVADIGTADAEFIIRGRPLDAKQELGDWVYSTTPFRVENHKIFAPGGPKSDIAGARVGHTVTNLTVGLENSDPRFPGQSFLVVGGETAAGAGGTNTVDVMLVNALSAETSTADRFASPDFQLPTPRAWHSATMLDDGRVLIAGGVDGSGVPLGTTVLYDPVLRQMVPGPNLNVARSHHAAVLLPSGDVAFFGGKTAGGALTGAVEIFRFEPVVINDQPSTLSVDLVPESMAVPQHTLHAVLMPDQTVLVTGGIDGSNSAVQTAQIFDPFNDDDPTTPRTKDPAFLETPGLAMLEARKFGAAVPLLDGNVLFAGGASSPSKASMELFNHMTGTFESIDVQMPDGGRSDMIATLLGDGTVLLAGGTSDPDLANAALVAQADVFRLGARTGNTWTGDFLPVNGDLGTPRRGARATAIDNGRVMIVGGQVQDGTSTQTTEVYVPQNGSNLRPTARTVLQSNRQSWAFGAPILYRLSDPEADDVRVVVQWSDDAKDSWRAASSQPGTIAGDVAELTAALASTETDDLSVAINNFNFEWDHIYIWQMTSDIERPPFGGEITPINVRVIPFGAVRGVEGASVPITILFNTKVITTILPLEDDDGVVTSDVGGDIRLNVHLRDIDGVDNGPGTLGDEADVLYEYAVDSNRNNQIDTNEFWIAMTPKGAPANDPNAESNPQIDRQTYNDSFLDSDPVNRPAGQGWTVFDWDSVFDLGVPATEFDNIWVRVTPSDADIGLAAILRNVPGEDDSINVVPHPEALRLLSYNGRGGSETDTVSVNQPVEFNFQGTVDPASVSGDTLEIFRGSSRVTGQYTVTNDVGNNSSVVTFFPDLQDLEDSQPSIGLDDATTVFFPLQDYSIRIPAYVAGDDPLAGTMLRPLVGVPDTYSTFRLVQNVLIDGELNPRYTFGTNEDQYDDGAPVAFGASIPAAGGTLASAGESSFTVNHAIDVDSVASPNVEMVIINGSVTSVIPGTWSVENVRNPDGTTSSTLSFEPLIAVPPSATVTVRSGAGLIGSNGTTATGVGRTFSVTNYGAPVSTSFTERFDDQDRRDAGATTADWGTDPCNAGVLTGLQGDTSALPAGGSVLNVAAGGSEVISGTLNDYDSITIQPGGEVIVRADSAATIRVDGDFIIDGTLSFRGEDGVNGHFGSTAERWVRNATRNVGTRAGGRGYNGGNDGGDSLNTSTASHENVRDGIDGDGTGGGEGGFAPSPAAITTTNGWYYGAGGGAGGGHATRGLNGGSGYHNTSGTTNALYGQQSAGGIGNVGDANMTSGPSVGGGGGGGGSNGYNNVYRYLGGAGGASAGAITVITNGVFRIGATGIVDGRGGAGGDSNTRSGSGGAGAGGGLLVRAGGGADLNGIIDMRGGIGGTNGYGEWNDRTAYWYAIYHGSTSFGGDGGLGRVRIESASFANIANVRVLGALETHQIDEFPDFPTSTPTAQDTVFNGTGTSTRDFGNTTEVFYTSLNVAAGKTAILKGNNPLTIFVRDDVTIDGTIIIDGDTGMPTNLNGFNSTNSVNTSLKGASGQLGGGDGGDPWNHGAPGNRRGGDGTGAAPGKNIGRSNSGYALSSSYSYLTGDSGGGGGGNATGGLHGHAAYAVPGIYRYEGAVNDVVTSGFNGLVDHNGGDEGGLITASEMSLDNLDDWAPGGGGGGNAGADDWTSSTANNSFGTGGVGGGAAGILAIVTQNDITVNGTLQGRGGEGRAPNVAYMSSYSSSGGGGAAGGTFYLIGDDVTLREATSETGAGATVDVTGGLGGGHRQVRGRAGRNAGGSLAGGAWLTYPVYNSHGSFGGDGGFGRLRIDYKTSLNGEADKRLVNKWGMTQTAFHDNRNYYRALAGSFTTGCYVAPRGDTAQSTWLDLGSVVPNVTGLSAVSANVGSVAFTVDGAQSHPHNLGPDGVGEPDASTATGFSSLGAGLLGRRWVRFKAVFTRSSSTTANPEISEVTVDFDTDPDDT